MKKYIFLIAILLTSTILNFAQNPVTFMKKGKYGLMDSKTGKELHKAQYDSIHPFEGKYALVEKKGKFGLLKKDGSEYLPCKYSKILFPVFESRMAGDYFWVSKDGKKYFATAAERYYEDTFDDVFYGPNGYWYTKEGNRWIVRTSMDYGRPLEGNPPTRTTLDNGYFLFDNVLYSPDGKKMKEGIKEAKLKVLSGNEFYFFTSDNKIVGLMHKTKLNFYDKIKSIKLPDSKEPLLKFSADSIKDHSIGVIGSSVYVIVPFLKNNSSLNAIVDPNTHLMGVLTDNDLAVPIQCTNISIDDSGYKVNGKSLVYFTIESNKPIRFEQGLNRELNKIGYPYLIITKYPYFSNLYNSDGTKIAEDFSNLSYNGKVLSLTEDGKTVKMTLDGHRDIEGYDETIRDRMWGFGDGDIIVKKNGKYGLYREGEGEVIPPLYDKLSRNMNHIWVTKDGLQGLYYINGELMIEPKYKWIKIASDRKEPSQNHYFVKSSSGAVGMVDRYGKIVLPFGTVDRFDFETFSNLVYVLFNDEDKICKVFKNGKMGFLDLTTHKVVVPCLYEDGTEQYSNDWYPKTRIAVARELPNRNIVIDIYSVKGGKIASRTFSQNEKMSMLYFMEKQLNVDLYILD